jgi:molecular chaperone GrpE (heat shock protein)
MQDAIHDNGDTPTVTAADVAGTPPPTNTPPSLLDGFRTTITDLMRQALERRMEARKLRHEMDRLDEQVRAVLLDLAQLAEEYDPLIARARRGGQDPLPETWLRRFERIAGILERTLARHHVTVRQPAGRPQPGLDEVTEHVPAPPGVAPGEIVEIVKTGLLWRGQALRRAQVVVAE